MFKLLNTIAFQGAAITPCGNTLSPIVGRAHMELVKMNASRKCMFASSRMMVPCALLVMAVRPTIEGGTQKAPIQPTPVARRPLGNGCAW